MIGAKPTQLNLSADQAIHEVLKIEQRTASLLQRTVGMTWMLWAFITGGVFVSLEAIGLAGPSGAAASVAYGLGWVPWILLGTLATITLWRSFAVGLPSLSARSRGLLAAGVAIYLVLILGGLAVVTLTKLLVPGPAWGMFAVGIAAAVVGGSGFMTLARAQQALWFVGGIGVALLAVGIALFAGRFDYDPLGLFLILGPVASSGLLFGGGLYTASR